MFPKELANLLAKREFISVATCDFKGRPNAAPKFLLKVDGNRLYLVDYTIGTTWQNLKANPRISLSLIDIPRLRGYQINGSVKIISKGKVYEKMHKEMTEKEIVLTAQHIIDEIRGHAAHETFEVLINEKFAIFEVHVDEVVEMGIQGELKRIKKE